LEECIGKHAGGAQERFLGGESVAEKRRGRRRRRRQEDLMFGATVVAGMLLLGVLGYMLVIQEDPLENLVVYTNDPVRSLDPAVATDRASAVPINNIYETLVTYAGADSVTLVPALALSWEVSQDGTWYNFSLRQGVRFSNGNSLTSADVKFTMERVLSIRVLQGAEDDVLMAHVDLGNTTTPDDYTISVKLLKPHAGFLAMVAKAIPMGILDKEYSLAHYSPSDLFAMSFLREHPVGTGPYALDHWSEGSSLVMLKNRHYWRAWDDDHYKRVTLREGHDVGVRKEALLDGGADMIELPVSSFSDLGSYSGFGVKQTRDFRMDMIVMNTKSESSSHAFMRDSGVRRAFCYAFNYQNVSANLYHGQVESLQGVIPNGFPLEDSVQQYRPFSYNLTVASELLNQSGYPLDMYGRRFGGTYVDFLLNKSDPQKVAVAYAFKEDLRRIGINMSLRNATERYIQVTGYWDMCIVSYLPGYIDASDPVRAIAMSAAEGGDMFFTGIENPTIDSAAANALASATEQGRIENYSLAWRSYNSDPNAILMGQVRQVCVYSPLLKDFAVNPVTMYSFYDYWE
jgi:peptide/nickel transport system substrate-binding protein